MAPWGSCPSRPSWAPVEVSCVADGVAPWECGAGGFLQGPSASFVGITRSVEVLGGQGYSFHKFMGCGLFFFSCWKCVFIWLWQSRLPWILNCCSSRVLRSWPNALMAEGSLKEDAPQRAQWGTTGPGQPGCLLRRRQCSKEMQNATWMLWVHEILNIRGLAGLIVLLKKISRRTYPYPENES